MSCHLPAPGPRAPSTPEKPAPFSSAPLRSAADSSAAAEMVFAPPAGKLMATVASDAIPASSMPEIVTPACTVPGLISRNRLLWFLFLLGLNIATRCPASPRSTTSCMAVRKPSSVRM